MKGYRKFLSEFAVNLCSSQWLMLSASDLTSGKTIRESYKTISDNSHIYLICQRPAAHYTAESVSYTDGRLEGVLEYKVGGEPVIIPFRDKYNLLDGGVKVELSSYPHREIHTIDENGKIVRTLPANLLGLALHGYNGVYDPRYFEVLYVGQSFGDGTRSAFERLKSHETLQRILAEAQYNAPDNEIVLFMFVYQDYRILTHIDGLSKEAISDKRDKKRFYSIHENPLSERQHISLVEAALIRYFTPKYNKKYKETFPSESHKILQECYQLDFTGLVVEIDTEENGFMLWSERVKPSIHHIAQVELLTEETRRGFFYLSNDDGGFWEMPDVIR